MVCMAGILIQNAPELVVWVDPAHDFEDVLVAVVVDVAEGNPMALLQMAEPAGRAYVLESLSFVISKHPVRDQRGEARIAGAQVEIEPSVVVQIAEIGSHGEQQLIQTDF